MEKLLEKIITETKKYLPNLDEKKIRDAYAFALDCHKGQTRFSGEPYIIHPLMATEVLLSMRPDTDTICACILHDTIEDDRLQRDQELLKIITKKFGADVAIIVDGVSKLGRIKYRGKEREIESLRKMFVAMAHDIRVILVRLADRLHNMSTLQHVRRDKQERIAKETLEVYVPVAARIGVYNLKKQLEDKCFQQLLPKEYQEITEEIGDKRNNLEKDIKQGVAKIQKLLRQNNIHGEVQGRTKNPYSIYKKMQKKGFVSVTQVQDLFALRIVVNDIATCYSVLGLIHTTYTPLPNRFKDYIAKPKPNGYQSLHTDIRGLINRTSEIQIRTTEMHNNAEYGIAAHWNYKENKGQINIPKTQKSWLSNILKRHKHENFSSEFIANLTLDFFDDEIFVYTPEGDLKNLPEGSTPVDFAYLIHTDVGHSAQGAKADGNIVPLDYKLQNGQTIEIITKNSLSPNQYWLQFVKTSGAREKIKAFLAVANRDKNIRLGISTLNEILTKAKKPKLDNKYSALANLNDHKNSLTEREEILEKIGNSSLSPTSIFYKIYPDQTPKRTSRKRPTKKSVKTKNVIIGGQSGIKVKFAECCKPRSGNPIFGYAATKGDITIHRKDCPYKNTLNPKRILPAHWEGDEDITQMFRIEIHLDQNTGKLGDILNKFYEKGIEVQTVQSTYLNEDKVLFLEIITQSEKETQTLHRILETNQSVKSFSIENKGEIY